MAVFALFVAACSSTGADSNPSTVDAGDETTTTDVDSTTQTTTAGDATTTTAGDGTTTTAAPEATTTTSGRPAAPDFTLELGDGGTYTLSEGSKPVYLVFWAEW